MKKYFKKFSPNKEMNIFLFLNSLMCGIVNMEDSFFRQDQLNEYASNLITSQINTLQISIDRLDAGRLTALNEISWPQELVKCFKKGNQAVNVFASVYENNAYVTNEGFENKMYELFEKLAQKLIELVEYDEIICGDILEDIEKYNNELIDRLVSIDESVLAQRVFAFYHKILNDFVLKYYTVE